jgi:hypothetical protein
VDFPASTTVYDYPAVTEFRPEVFTGPEVSGQAHRIPALVMAIAEVPE